MINNIMTEKQEEQMVHLVRNALLVAGQEMDDGDQPGDHWPVIKSTIHAVMKDWEDLKIERNVQSSLKEPLYAQIKIIEDGLLKCSPEVRAALEPKLKEFREVCDAYFTDCDVKHIGLDHDAKPSHILHMNAILDTLEEENG